MTTAVTAPTAIETDVVIIGGGIAGLWLFRTLHRRGYRVLLLEHQTLGGGQTGQSQGIIHGGTKYTLSGRLTGAAHHIAAMPDRWRQALAGTAGDTEPDLRQATILSQHQWLWAPNRLDARFAAFFASKALRSRVTPLKPSQFPAIFRHGGFQGRLYQLNEMVLDVPSVVAALVNGLEPYTVQVDWQRTTRLQVQDNAITAIELHDPDQPDQQPLRIRARRYVLAAGAGNAALMARWGLSEPRMQVRPLHMVMVRHRHPEPLFAHCLGMKSVPRVTITSHPDQDSQWVWYLGGDIAETGNARTATQQIQVAQQEMQTLLPWVNWAHAQWATRRINRAEPQQIERQRPDTAFYQTVGNGIITWPTKLALAPQLADGVMALLAQANISPSSSKRVVLPQALPRPQISKPFWSNCFD